jgi:hypothetical protein
MTINTLAKRLRILEDIEEIEQLQVHYLDCLNLADWDGVIDCFTEDGIVDINAGYAKGKEQLTRLFKEVLALTHIGQEGPFAVHPIILISGDKARGSWLVYIRFARPRKLKPKPTILSTEDAPEWVQGYYENEYKRVNGKWKISLLKFRNRLISPMS